MKEQFESKLILNGRRNILLFITFFHSCYFCFGQIKIADSGYLDHYTHFDTSSFDFQSLSDRLKNGGLHSLELFLKSYGNYRIEISPSNLELANTQYFVIGGNNKILVKYGTDFIHWKGTVSGTNKIVRLNIYPDHLSGYIEQDTGFVFIETISITGQNRLFIYHSSETKQDEMMNFCNVKDDNLKNSGKLNKKTITYEPLSCNIVKIACVATYGLFKKNNYDTIATFNEIKDIFNLADGIYAKYVGVRLKIASQAISFDSMRVYNNSRSTLDRIYDFESAMLKFKGSIVPDIYHLFMENYSPTDQAVGRGALGNICGSKSTSVSMDYGNLNMRTVILSHELGHNLNANHEEGRNCTSQTAATIMCPSANSNMLFASSEVAVINQFMAAFLKNNPNTNCLSYPIPDDKIQLDLCNKDSVLLYVGKGPDYGLLLYHEEKLMNDFQDEEINIWLKEPGLYKIRYITDTVSDLACFFDKIAFAAERNFVVSNPLESGPGSLKYAILNANGCLGADTITFRLADSVSAINITEVLPPILDNCMIDGTSQKSFLYPTATRKFQPKVVLVNKLPTTAYVKYGLLFSKNHHTVKGIEFRDFEQAVTNDFTCFKYSIWNYLLREENRQEPSSMGIFANKFTNNKTGIYLSYYDTIANNEQTIIGDGTLSNANFFSSAIGTGMAIRHTQNLKINGNYFGMEPGIDTAQTVQNPINLYNCYSQMSIANNHFGNSQWYGIYGLAAGGNIFNNTFGLNPFNGHITGFTGSAIFIDAYQENQILLIGGIGNNEGNIFYNQKKGSSNGTFISRDAKNVHFVGNKVINPDSAVIQFMLYKFTVPVKSIVLDSAVHQCFNNNSTEIFGQVIPNFLNDTLTLHFYSTPPDVKDTKEPMHNYLGSKILITSDTLSISFTHILADSKINEGIVYTATSQKMNHTSKLSNVIYPKSGSSLLATNLADTTLCPYKSLNLTFNSRFSDFKVNNLPVGKNYVIDKPGLYEIEAKDENGCAIRQTHLVNSFPNYLKDAKISGTDYYSWNETYYFDAVDYYDPKKWGHPVWSVFNGYVEDKSKYRGLALFLKDTARITYQITDSNRCTYSISKTVYHNTVGVKDHLEPTRISIYPNPSDGLFTLSMSKPQRMILYNSVGAIIETYPAMANGTVLNLSGFSSGLYFLWVENYGGFKLFRE